MVLTEEKIEDYFIQFLFCRNKELLRQENREFYDALLCRYLMEWKNLPKYALEMDGALEIVNNNFANDLFEKKIEEFPK